MIRWIPLTFVRITVSLIAGIVVGIFFPELVPFEFALVCFASAGVLYIMAWLFVERSKATLLGVIGLSGIFLGGYLHLILQTDSNNTTHLLKSDRLILYYRVKISSFTQSKNKSWKTEGIVDRYYSNGRWNQTSSKILLYFSKEEFENSFDYGDILLIKGSPQEVKGPANPGEFDYKRYLGFRNIYHQHFLKRDDVQRLSNEPSSYVLAYSIQVRSFFEKLLRQHVTGDREKAIAIALVLGITDGLDNELLSAYAATGAMHVLAVSGLHVSIIYLILIWLMKPLTKRRSGPWILAIVSLVVLWIYAFVTGLSPSVLRAVVMFSFVALAKPMNQSTNIYNTLAASAFCILLFDPMLIMSVGFQLSYIAVIGILYYQRPLYRLWNPKLKILDEAWKVTAVSIAAQISTFALGLLYFHQFPNYFLLCNLLVIPGSFAVLVLGLLVLVFSFVPYLIDVIGWLLTWSIKLLNAVVFTVESLPFSLVENINIDAFQCIIIMLMIAAVTILIRFRTFQFVLVTFMLAAVLSFSQWERYLSVINQNHLVIYKVDRHHAMDLIDNGIAYFGCDSLLAKDSLKVRFHIQPLRLTAGVTSVSRLNHDIPIQSVTNGQLIRWRDKTILHLTGDCNQIPQGVVPDFLIISNDGVSTLAFLGDLKPTIILDSSNSYFYNKRLIEQANALRLPFHSVSESGAFNVCLSCSDS